MNTFIIDNDSTSIEHLTQLCSQLLNEPQTIHYSQLQNTKIKPEDLVILSGSHTLTAAWHDNEFSEELALLRNHNGPLVGICFGMQLIAHAYGAHLHLLPRKRYGIAPMQPDMTYSIFGDEAYPQVFESHSWSVKKLVDPLVSVAESGAGVEIFRHKSRPQYGLQFHPEATDDIDGKAILRRILAEIVPS